MTRYEQIGNWLKQEIEGIVPDLGYAVYYQNVLDERRITLPAVVICLEDLQEIDVSRTFTDDLRLYRFFIFTLDRRTDKEDMDTYLQVRWNVDDGLDGRAFQEIIKCDITPLRIIDNPRSDESVFTTEQMEIVAKKAKQKYMGVRSVLLAECLIAEER